ncbi:MAG: DivIVA domain-containing protein [Cytophagaceae bacterium]|nr:DivIVA domain-containing protein [Cytophagaceae bacterium]
MKITPIEIRQKDFQKAFRGYEKEEVDAFLLSLSQEWERIMDENKELRRKLETTEREVTRLREVESSLFKTLKTAEDTGATMIDHANKTAELHLKEAQIKAAAMMSEAKSQARAMVEEAEMKSKEIIEEMQDEAKALQKDYSYMLDQRDNLLDELRHLSNDILEKVNKIISRHKGIDENIKEMRNLAMPEKKSSEPGISGEQIQAQQTINQNKKDSEENFFDSIK